ncbi:MAG: family 1 glycosylhydrolase [Saprospiraceae bacterium]|nr:family 1 glycosylhydrolase [Saprospiraceae bacterium]
MKLEFPKNFLWGTSTSAAQTETAFDHQWKGFVTRDEFVFERTTDHEKRREEDIEYIRQFGSVYRCGIDWSRLQRAPYADFDEATVAEYQDFFTKLNNSGTKILLVLHHFAHPYWFEQNGGWLNRDNIPTFIDYARQCITHFGKFVFNWNTFNEPNAYAICSYLLGMFPPQKRNYIKANRALRHIMMAHSIVYDLIKQQFPDHWVSVSLNMSYFKHLNTAGYIPARFADWWYNRRSAKVFLSKMDYWGISYYAYVPMNPFPITELDNPGRLDKLKIRHDKMWGYNPDGLGILLKRVFKWRRMPIILVENGICTDDPSERIKSIKEYLKVIYDTMQMGVDIRGYIHWSTWDNFEWNLGPSYRFGLVHVNNFTKDRTMTEAGRFYANITQENAVDI